jgi:hypothetical protein
MAGQLHQIFDLVDTQTVHSPEHIPSSPVISQLQGLTVGQFAALISVHPETITLHQSQLEQ